MRVGGVVYAGDPYKPAQKDIASLVRALKELGVHVIAIQNREFGRHMLQDKDSKSGELSHRENYSFVDAAIIYETERKKDG